MNFLYSNWRGLPLPTRVTLATAFGIAKVGSTHVVNNVVESDGYKIEDVERALNIDAIQLYTGSTSTDMQVLWDAMIAKAEGRVPEAEIAAIVTEPTTVNETVIAPPKKKRAYNKKK